MVFTSRCCIPHGQRLLVNVAVHNDVGELIPHRTWRGSARALEALSLQVSTHHHHAGVRDEELPSPRRTHNLPEVGTPVGVTPRLGSESAAVVDAAIVFDGVEPRVGTLTQLTEPLLQCEETDKHLALVVKLLIALLECGIAEL